MSDFKCPHPDCEESEKRFETEGGMKTHYGMQHEGSLAKEKTICSTDECTNKFDYYPSEKSGKLCEKCTKENNRHLTEQDVEFFEVACANCDSKKTVPESSFKNYDIFFCGNKCRKEYYEQTETIECEHCGNIKTVGSWEIEQGRRYCGRKCYKEDNNNPDDGFNHNYYGKSFEEVRKNVRERDNKKCQVCGKDESDLGIIPSAHHITPVQWFIDTDGFSKDDSNYKENLVLLCKRHHSLADFNKINLGCELDDELVESLELENPVEEDN